MSPFATVKSVRQAGRLIKRLMNHHPEGWGDLVASSYSCPPPGSWNS